MSGFRVGDRVKRTSALIFHRGMFVGDEDVVVGVKEGGALTLQKYGEGHNPKNFMLVTPKYPNPPHKHAEVIKAWADGAVVQLWNTSERRWEDLMSKWPAWCEDILYRIKPQPESHPNEEKIAEIESTISQLQQQVKELKDVGCS